MPRLSIDQMLKFQLEVSHPIGIGLAHCYCSGG